MLNHALSLQLFQDLSENESQCIQGGAGAIAPSTREFSRLEGDPDRPLITGIRAEAWPQRQPAQIVIDFTSAG